MRRDLSNRTKLSLVAV